MPGFDRDEPVEQLGELTRRTKDQAGSGVVIRSSAPKRCRGDASGVRALGGVAIVIVQCVDLG